MQLFLVKRGVMPMDKKKGINTTELTLLIIGSTIGSGVFGITSDLATAAAPGPAILALLELVF